MDRERLLKETCLIVGWLERHPEERALILWQAAQEEWPAPIGFAASSEAASVTLTAHREHLRRFMAAATFEPCAQCYLPCVYLPDMTVLAYPAMTLHDCGGVAGDTRRDRPTAVTAPQRNLSGPSLPPAGSTPARSPSAPVAQRAEQRPRTPQVAGSKPAGGSTPPQERVLLR